MSLTIGHLPPDTGTLTTELLWLHPSWIGNKEGPVVLHKDLLDFGLGLLVNILLIIGNDGLADGLADSIDLANMTTTVDAKADVKLLHTVLTDKEKWLHQLSLKGLASNLIKWGAVQLDKATALMAVSNSGGGSLAAEDLNTLHW